MADATLEERVEALETQIETLTENIYRMAYSGEQMESILDFVHERGLRAGTASARFVATVSGQHIYLAVLGFKRSAFAKEPVVRCDLAWSASGSSNVHIVTTATKTIEFQSGYYLLTATTTTKISDNATIFFYYAFLSNTEN